MQRNKQTINVTPVTALQHLDSAVGKVQGTRSDFKILDMSLQVLSAVVTEHARYKAEFGPLPPLEPPAPAKKDEKPVEKTEPEADAKTEAPPLTDEATPKNGAGAQVPAEDAGEAPTVQ